MTLCFYSEDFFSKCEILFRPDLADKAVLVVTKTKTGLFGEKILSANKIAKTAGFFPGNFLSRNSILPEGASVFYENPLLYEDMGRRMLCVCRRFSDKVDFDENGNINLLFPDCRSRDFSSFSSRIAKCIKKETGIDVNVKIINDVGEQEKKDREKNYRKMNFFRRKHAVSSFKMNTGNFPVKYSPLYTTDTSALPVVR